VLSTLQAEGIRATFFVTGDFARRFPSQVRRIAAAGHRVGNHSDRHPEYPKLTDVEIRADLARAESAIRSAAGVAAKPLFRFPFGARGTADIRVVNGAGYVPVRWTVDTLGWKGTSGGISASTVVQRVLDSARPGQIVLMHLGANPDDGTTLDAEALPRIVAGLRAAGYDFVTLDALLA
jgi:peptidoglycan-N-acetylglucosamine deacetylase